MYNVYARTDENKKVIKIFSDCFETSKDNDILIKQGDGDEFTHTNYYEIIDNAGCYNYKIEDGVMVRCTDVEKKAELKNTNVFLAKCRRIKESKKELTIWLEENPMISKVHNPAGEYYTVTQEKQEQLTQLLMLYNIAAKAGDTMKLTWNCTGGICEEWSYEELSALSFQIASYVLPRVKKQQTYEVRINNCTKAEEVDAIEIEYETVS